MKKQAAFLAATLTLTALAATAATYAGYTAPGTQLAVGGSAVLPVHIPYKGAFPVKITVTSVERGSLDDFRKAGLTIPPKMEHDTPYYVNYKVELVSMNGYKTADVGGMSAPILMGIDNLDGSHFPIELKGTAVLHGARFNKCRYLGNSTFSQSAHPGETYSSCNTYMINSEGRLKGLQITIYADNFNGNRAYQDHPVFWAAGAAGQPASSQPGASSTGDNNW